jgi:integrase
MRLGFRGVKLKHLNQVGVFPSGNARFYYRPKGQKGVKLPDAPMGDPVFLAAYAKAAGVQPRKPVQSGSLAASIALYKASGDFKILAESTRNNRRPMLDDISECYGNVNPKDLQQKHIQKDLERFESHAKNNHLKTWRGFCKWLTSHHRLDASPCANLHTCKTKKSDGFIPWDAGQIQQFRDYWRIGTMERLAFELIFWTGARVSDAIRLGAGNIDKEGWLTFRQQKTGGEVSIPFKRELPEFLECYSDDLAKLHQSIDARNERHMTFLHTQPGASRSPKAVSQWFAAKARKAGILGRSAHGLRKSRAIALAEAGGTSPQIGAWTGHESLKEIERYIKNFNKKKALSKTEPEQKVPTRTIQFQLSRKKETKSNG